MPQWHAEASRLTRHCENAEGGWQQITALHLQRLVPLKAQLKTGAALDEHLLDPLPCGRSNLLGFRVPGFVVLRTCCLGFLML